MQRNACLAAALGRYDAILTRKSCTNTAIAACLATMVHSIIADSGAIFPVSVRPHAAYGIPETVALGLPCAIGRGGVRAQRVIPLTDEETFGLGLSAATLMTGYESVLGDGTLAATG
jgi:malate/lactate dehydrogenase